MASELSVQTIKGPASGGNANKIIIPTGQTLEVTDNIRYEDMPAGSIIQVITDDFATVVGTTSTSFVDTGVQATITPRFATSKIFINVSQAFSMVGPNTNQYQANLIIATGGNTSLFGNTTWDQFRIKDMTAISWQATMQYTHSPATTSASTYKTRMKSQYGTGNNVYAQYTGSMSSITLMEIKQ
tara:strand:+ start:312 stop:866 length:555 start_codon:yes stop_codon:yes gene_type:complete